MKRSDVIGAVMVAAGHVALVAAALIGGASPKAVLEACLWIWGIPLTAFGIVTFVSRWAP